MKRSNDFFFPLKILPGEKKTNPKTETKQNPNGCNYLWDEIQTSKFSQLSEQEHG